ncbi:MAG: hypothetical protein HQL48_04880 [Gammaproteobacteria bacterium]|nr:hypothetical protein [Gammaproteobacteria bacterium]
MLEYFQTHPETFWFCLGFLLLTVETLILGMSTGVILFAGVAALLTGGLIWSGLLPGDLLWGIGGFGVSSLLLTLLLWRPFLALQRQGDPPNRDRSSDFIGHRFRLQQQVSQTEPGETDYSGITWRVELDESEESLLLESGVLVEVRSLTAGCFRVGRVGDRAGHDS